MAGLAGRRVGKLAARRVETVTKPGLYGDGANLYLKVDASGAKSWIFRWEIGGGKVRKVGLGPLHTISLTDARDRAEDARKLILDGIDPRQARREAKAAAAIAEAKLITFDAARDAYIESHRAGWKSEKHAAQWKATLATYASPVFGALPVGEIDVGLVMRALEAIWKTKSETAHRVRGRVESVLDWAKVRGYRSGENPARWKGHLDHLLPARRKVRKVKHHPALPFADLPAFMRDLREQYGISPLALEFTILTAARTNEVLGARPAHFDLANALWTIPGEAMKGERDHRVPLCDRAVAIVKEMMAAYRGPFVFPGAKRGKPLSNMAMLNTLGRMGRDDITVHGFRSSFRDWAGERTNFAREVIEVALSHKVGDETEQAYARGDLFDKRRRLMNAWAAFIESRPAAKASGSNVTALRP
jgi:integrase